MKKGSVSTCLVNKQLFVNFADKGSAHLGSSTPLSPTNKPADSISYTKTGHSLGKLCISLRSSTIPVWLSSG